MKTFTLLLIWLSYIWGVSYSFHLFPWVKDTMEWWYIPHVLTVIVIGIPFVLLSGEIEKL